MYLLLTILSKLLLCRIILTRAPRFVQLCGHHKFQTGKTTTYSFQKLPGVWDQNQVLVSGTETKVQFQYWYQSRNFFFRNRNFFFQNFSNFLMFFCFLGGYKFLQAWNWTQIFKIDLKILNIWQQIWFVAFCSFFTCSLTVFHRGRQQKSGGRQWKSSRAGQQNIFPNFSLISM